MRDDQTDPFGDMTEQKAKAPRVPRKVGQLLVAAGLFLVLSAVVALLATREWYEYTQINEYGQPAEATIVGKEMSPGWRFGPHYWIYYEYQVTMPDDTIWVGRTAADVAEEQYAKFEIGSKLTVYYSTSDYRVTSLGAPDPAYRNAVSILSIWCLVAALALAGLMAGIWAARQDGAPAPPPAPALPPMIEVRGLLLGFLTLIGAPALAVLGVWGLGEHVLWAGMIGYGLAAALIAACGVVNIGIHRSAHATKWPIISLVMAGIAACVALLASLPLVLGGY